MTKSNKHHRFRALNAKSTYQTYATKQNAQHILRLLWKWAILPSLIYTAIFFLTQRHLWGHFSTDYFFDKGDGFQNIWNIWWVNRSVTAGQNPYYTTMLHWPHGVSLLAQTMNIVNGLMTIPLIHWFGFSLVLATNTMIMLSYIGTGVTMLWFTYKLVDKYWPAVIAGALLTFSTYHIAHGRGHMQLMTMQYIPLFLLAFWLLMQKVRYRYAIFAAIALLLVLLSDYYYFFWSVIVGAMYFAWVLYKRQIKLNNPQTLKVLAVFAVLAGALTIPLVRALINLNNTDPLTGAHDSLAFSLDPLSLIIPGGSWRGAGYTYWHWKRLSFTAETSVFFGWALVTTVLVAFVRSFIYKKRAFKAPAWLNFWWIVMFVFGIFALGPHPYIFGHRFKSINLPYFYLEQLSPTLRLSGMPVRWVLISLIAAIIIGAYMLSRLDLKTRRGKILLGLFIVVSCIDLWPIGLPRTNPQDNTPAYVYRLRDLPQGAVIDNAAMADTDQLFHQTVHGKPIGFGYISRVPNSVNTKDFLIFAALEEGRHDDLCRVYQIRYVTTPAFRPLKTGYPVLFNDGNDMIYDMKNSPNC